MTPRAAGDCTWCGPCADAVGVSVLRELGASRGGKLLWAECRRDDLP
ncbi:hypothetical protein ACIQHU_37845 [Streptomyces tendae]